jgi:hypothetical protein
MKNFVICENKSIIFRVSGEGILPSRSINNRKINYRDCNEKTSCGI